MPALMQSGWNSRLLLLGMLAAGVCQATTGKKVESPQNQQLEDCFLDVLYQAKDMATAVGVLASDASNALTGCDALGEWRLS